MRTRPRRRMVRQVTNRWIASYEMAYDEDYLEHYGRIGMKWGQHIFAKDPAKGRAYIDRKRKALSANVALARDAARRGNAKKLAKINAKTKKMVADVKQLEEMYEQATGEKYSSGSNVNNAEVEKQHNEETKQTILRSGSAKDVFAIKDQLTQTELQDAINRIQKENTLESLKTQEAMNKIQKAEGFVRTATNAASTAVNAFNTYEKVAEMTNKITGEDTLPIFTGKKEREKKKKDKKRAETVEAMMKRGDPKEIYDHLHLFTNDEVAAVNKRLTNKGLIKDKVDKDVAAKEAEVQKAKDKKVEDFKKQLAKEKEFKNVFDEWDDYVKEESAEKNFVKDVIDSAFKDYERSTRSKGKPTAETYGLDKILTPSAEEKASEWISSFLDYEKKSSK